MESGQTVLGYFYSLKYDGIRPAKIRSSFELKHSQPVSNSTASKGKIIPIQVEYHAPKRAFAVGHTPENTGSGTPASPIAVGVTLDLVEPTRSRQSNLIEDLQIIQSLSSKTQEFPDGVVGEKHNSNTDSVQAHKSLKERHPFPGDTIDLTEMPSVQNNFLEAKGQTAIAYPKREWTEIPIHHSRDSSSAPCQSNVSKPCENIPDVEHSKQLKNEVDIKHHSVHLNDEIQLYNQSNVSSRSDLHTKPDDLNLLPSNPFKKAFSGLSDLTVSSLHPAFEEQEINLTPSYPVYELLKDQLSKENRMIDYIRGDGNCFFRALSKQLYGTEKYHKALRSLTVDIIATNRRFFTQFIDGGNVQSHLEQMSEESTWATTCEIYAAATLLQRDIYMLTPDQSNKHYTWLLFKPQFKLQSPFISGHGLTTLPHNKKPEDLCYLTLCNTNGNHYDRVVPGHGGCNCFLAEPHLEGQSGSLVID